MPRIPFLLILSLICLLFGLIPSQALAQDKKSKDRDSERLFLLYSLEDLSRRLPFDPKNLTRQSQATFLIARFSAEQRFRFDTLRRFASSKGEPESVIKTFNLYEKELNAWEDLAKSWEKSLKEKNMIMESQRMAAGSRALMNGLSYGLLSFAKGDEDETPFVKGFAGFLGSSMREQAKLKETEAQVAKDLNKELNEAWEESMSHRAKAHGDFQKSLEKCVKEQKFANAQFAYQVDRMAEARFTDQNPFLVAQKAKTKLKDPRAPINELMDQVELCTKAMEKVPPSSIWNYYRAYFQSLAGLLANQAAAKEIGATGLPINRTKATKIGKTARYIWYAYSKESKFKTTGSTANEEVIEACMLAHAYAGEPEKAIEVFKIAIFQKNRAGQLVLIPKPDNSQRPEFWYAGARICSMGGSPELSILCLQTALKYGFDDKEHAKITPDLLATREHPATALAFKKLFP